VIPPPALGDDRTLRRIQEATGVRRETASAYLKAAGIAVPGPRHRELTRNPASAVSTDPVALPPGVTDHIPTSPGPRVSARRRRSVAFLSRANGVKRHVLGTLAHWPVLPRPELASFQASPEARTGRIIVRSAGGLFASSERIAPNANAEIYSCKRSKRVCRFPPAIVRSMW
jgi:hypothetical protein